MTASVGNQSVSYLNTPPVKVFSCGVQHYFISETIEIDEPSPACLEDDVVFLYISEGKGSVWINGLTFPVSSGCLLILHAFHCFRLVPDTEEHIEASFCVVDYKIMNYLYIYQWIEKDVYTLPPVIALNQEDRSETEKLLHLLQEESLKKSTKSDTLITIGLLGHFIVTCLKAQINNTEDVNIPLGWNILLYITKYSNRKLIPLDVANHFDIPIPVMNRELRRITTYSFAPLLRRARINVVCSAMPFQDVSLRYLASYSGFSSENSFYRAFCQHHGITPQQYRDQMLQNDRGLFSKNTNEEALLLVHYIMSHYRENISMKTAAEDLFISERNINDLLIDYLDMTFRELVTSMRLRYASSLMLTSNMPVIDIAEESGFNSLSTFYRVFKNTYGLSATDYRNAILKAKEIKK